MQPTYEVALTATAEASYRKLYEETQQGVGNGGSRNQRGSLLASVDRALDEAISMTPFTAGQPLAGVFSNIYMLNLGPTCIFYVAYEESRLVYVLHIGAHAVGADLSWLKDAVLRGEAGDLLQELGIDQSHLLGHTFAGWLN